MKFKVGEFFKTAAAIQSGLLQGRILAESEKLRLEERDVEHAMRAWQAAMQQWSAQREIEQDQQRRSEAVLPYLTPDSVGPFLQDWLGKQSPPPPPPPAMGTGPLGQIYDRAFKSIPSVGAMTPAGETPATRTAIPPLKFADRRISSILADMNNLYQQAISQDDIETAEAIARVKPRLENQDIGYEEAQKLFEEVTRGFRSKAELNRAWSAFQKRFEFLQGDVADERYSEESISELNQIGARASAAYAGKDPVGLQNAIKDFENFVKNAPRQQGLRRMAQEDRARQNTENNRLRAAAEFNDVLARALMNPNPHAAAAQVSAAYRAAKSVGVYGLPPDMDPDPLAGETQEDARARVLMKIGEMLPPNPRDMREENLKRDIQKSVVELFIDRFKSGVGDPEQTARRLADVLNRMGVQIDFDALKSISGLTLAQKNAVERLRLQNLHLGFDALKYDLMVKKYLNDGGIDSKFTQGAPRDLLAAYRAAKDEFNQYYAEYKAIKDRTTFQGIAILTDVDKQRIAELQQKMQDSSLIVSNLRAQIIGRVTGSPVLAPGVSAGQPAVPSQPAPQPAPQPGAGKAAPPTTETGKKTAAERIIRALHSDFYKRLGRPLTRQEKEQLLNVAKQHAPELAKYFVWPSR